MTTALNPHLQHRGEELRHTERRAFHQVDHVLHFRIAFIRQVEEEFCSKEFAVVFRDDITICPDNNTMR